MKSAAHELQAKAHGRPHPAEKVAAYQMPVACKLRAAVLIRVFQKGFWHKKPAAGMYRIAHSPPPLTPPVNPLARGPTCMFS